MSFRRKFPLNRIVPILCMILGFGILTYALTWLVTPAQAAPSRPAEWPRVDGRQNRHVVR